VWAGIVGDCLIRPNVLPHQLTGNHYRDFLLHNLRTLLENALLVEHERGTCMMVLWHILVMLCDMFSITAIMTDGYVEEDPLLGLHSRQI
jgi:hypothetical protein